MSIDWQRVKHLLAEAAARNSPAGRAAFLDDACRGQAALRAEVEKLLRAHDQAGEFLEAPAIPVPGIEPAASEQIGGHIGPYQLLQQIGEGGCGVVYMAEQQQPIRRRVALKVIKLGMDTKAVIARFEAERQALALMDHPHIARVFEAGATETGRPYFVMELVQGIKITDYCDQHRLATRERLHLFIQVCHALQHAHQKGIIHRDIKPSNILVTLQDGEPTPKVIDFGIAKATDQRLTDKTLFTGREQFVGTPAYMSPEQAQLAALDIDTRSDIYSLGVLLYELLTGQTPFDARELAAAGLDEMRRIIRETEPNRPSTRLSTLAAARQTSVARCRRSEPPQLIHLVRGDLDWIVMRCLEKDRARRYETANSLAEDLARHLHNEPVTARPPSRRYRLQKLAQRNKATFAAGTLVVVALVLGLGFSLWTLAKEQAARREALASERRALTEAGKSLQVARFLKDMLTGVQPSVALGRDTTMLREVLDKTAERVGKDLQDQPEVEAALRTTLGGAYTSLGQYEHAEQMFRTALALHRKLWGTMHTNVADAAERLGSMLLDCQLDVVESEPLLEEALMIRTNLLGAEHVQVAAVLRHLALLRRHQARPGEAEALCRRSLDLSQRLQGSENLGVVQSMFLLSSTLLDLGKPEQAEALVREALALQRRVLPDERAGLGTSYAYRVLALALRSQGKLEEAETVMRHAEAMGRELFGSGHPQHTLTLNSLADVLAARGKLEEAEKVAREALAVNRNPEGTRPAVTAVSLQLLGDLLRATRRFAEAETAYREALALWRSLNLPSGDYTPAGLVALLRDQGRLDEVEALCRENVAAISKTGPPARLASAWSQLGAILRERGKLPAAEAAAREALAQTKSTPGTDAHLMAVLEVIQSLIGQARFAEIKPLLEAAFTQARTSSNSWFLPQTYGIAAEQCLAEGDSARAEAMARAGLEISRRLFPASEQRQGLALAAANALKHQTKWIEAEAFYRESFTISVQLWPQHALRWEASAFGLVETLEVQSKQAELDAWCCEWAAAARKAGPSLTLVKVLALHGDLLRNQGKTAEAGRRYREGLEVYHSLKRELPETCQWLASGLGAALRSQGRTNEAISAYREAVISSAKTWPKDLPRWKWQLNDLLALLAKQGQAAEAEKLCAELSRLTGTPIPVKPSR